MISDKTKGLIFAFIALFSWGIHGVAGRYLAINGVNMIFVTAVRFWVGTTVFFLYLLFKRKLKVNPGGNWKKILMLSLVGLVGNSLFYHLALKYLPGTLVMILENMSPIFVFLFSFFIYNIKPKFLEIISLFLSFLGVLLIVFGKSSFSGLEDGFYLGIFFGILAAFTFGYYVFFSAVFVIPLKGKYDEIIRFLFSVFLISSIISLPALFLAKPIPQTRTEWFWLLEMGVFQSGVSYIFWNYALSLLPTNTTSVLFLFTIFFTTINEVLFLNLRLNLYLIIGGILIISSGYFLTKMVYKEK